jgi:hypothetical protein
MNALRPHDLFAFVVTLGLLAGAFALLILGETVPEWIELAVTGAMAFTFGRTIPGNVGTE